MLQEDSWKNEQMNDINVHEECELVHSKKKIVSSFKWDQQNILWNLIALLLYSIVGVNRIHMFNLPFQISDIGGRSCATTGGVDLGSCTRRCFSASFDRSPE